MNYEDELDLDETLTPKQLVKILKAHSVESEVTGDRVIALSPWTQKHPNGSVESFVTRDDVTGFTVGQIRDYLGY